MSITLDLTPEQTAWLAAQVAAGAAPTMEAAAQQALDDRIAESSAALEQDNLDWAKPLVDEGFAQFERGQFVTEEDHDAIIEAHFGSFRV